MITQALLVGSRRVIVTLVAALAMTALTLTAPACHHGDDAHAALRTSGVSAVPPERAGGTTQTLEHQEPSGTAAPGHCRATSAEHELTETVDHRAVSTAFARAVTPHALPTSSAPEAGCFDGASHPVRTLHLTLGVMRI